jgi:predicted membrane protein (TIGR00267 family)
LEEKDIGKLSALRSRVKSKDIGPILRRFFINTLFDSTFMLLGIIIGSAYLSNPDPSVILATMISSSFALGISTGVSVYESESMERERRIAELERALFRELNNTKIEEEAKTATSIISLINFITPLASCATIAFPFLLVSLGILDIRMAPWISVGLAMGIIFLAGAYLGRVGRTNPWIKGLKMVAFGFLAFSMGFLIQALV